MKFNIESYVTVTPRGCGVEFEFKDARERDEFIRRLQENSAQIVITTDFNSEVEVKKIKKPEVMN